MRALRCPVLRRGVGSSRGQWRAEWISIRHGWVDSRFYGGARPRRLLLGCSVFWKEIDQDTSRTEFVMEQYSKRFFASDSLSGEFRSYAI